MYQDYYSLRARPFELIADPAFLYLSRRHREALSVLEYGLSAGKPLTVLIGEAGTGKTTLLRAASESERCGQVTCVMVVNPLLTREEFVETLASVFELGAGAGQSKAQLLAGLETQLRQRRAAGEIVVLVLDEAHRLSDELIEEVRLLGNLETASGKLLPLVLAGQPELAERLEQPALRQVKQRIGLRCELAPLDLTETAAYIAHRIAAAGGAPAAVFTQEAVRAIHQAAGGIPRTISVVCDNALLAGMAADRRPVDRRLVEEVSRDLALAPRTVDSPQPPVGMPLSRPPLAGPRLFGRGVRR